VVVRWLPAAITTGPVGIAVGAAVLALSAFALGLRAAAQLVKGFGDELEDY
jgi:hypothetical protein